MVDSDRGPRREYRTDQIAVQWEPEYCIHTTNCIRSLPNVFNPRDRPWIHVDQASADAIAEAVLRCPTGALHFRRLDDGPQERPAEPSSIRPVRDGPLYIRGEIELQDEQGQTPSAMTRGWRSAAAESRSTSRSATTPTGWSASPTPAGSPPLLRGPPARVARPPRPAPSPLRRSRR